MNQPEDAFETVDSIATEVAEAHQERVEYALRGAILAGYDGVDIHTPRHGTPGLTEIEPWHYPEPDAANGKRTERFTWEWFDQERLQELIGDGRLPEVLNND